MNTVYARKAGHLENDVKKIIKELKIKELPKGSRIFIKINLSLDRKYPGTNTSPDFLYYLVKELSKDYNVSAGDSNASSCNASNALKVTGNAEAIIKAGGTPVNLSTDSLVLAKNKKCLIFKQKYMPENVINADAVISLALLKTHVFTTITGTIKNMFGTYPDLKVLHHKYLDKAIHDAVLLTKPSYAIIDGRVGMQGRGPVEGTPVKTGLYVYSRDCKACDSEAAKIMGFNPEEIQHLRLLEVPEYKLKGTKIRKHFKPATKGVIDKMQELSLKNNALTFLCYKTPIFKIIKSTAKTIKDIKRYLALK